MNPLYDKIAARGIAALSDKELLELFVEDDGVADALFALYGGALTRIAAEEPARLRMAAGLGLKRAHRFAAAVELGRRLGLSQGEECNVINSSEDVVKIFRPQLERLSHEECWVVYLTSSNRIIERQRVSQGGVQGTVVDYRIIIKRALELLATQLILIHNHPSGAASASPQDEALTKRLNEAAALFDIRLLDHIIIAREGDYSFRRAGTLF